MAGKYDDKKDSQTVNDILKKLQQKGANIKNVRIGASYWNLMYLIEYEAPSPIDV